MEDLPTASEIEQTIKDTVDAILDPKNIWLMPKLQAKLEAYELLLWLLS